MTTNPPIIGIIGGFGADTSATFCVRLVEHAHAIKPSHPPAFAVDFVSVPPELSGKAINGSREAGTILAGAVSDSIARLHSIGVQTVALPCNTLHLFADSFAVPSPLHLLHIVDAVLQELKSEGITRVGLLATQLTVSSRLYADRLAASGVHCITPSASLQQELSEAIGHFVETGGVSARTSQTFREAFDEFKRKGVTAVVLGCTDLSGMLERCGFKAPIKCIDSMDVLAKACARLCV